MQNLSYSSHSIRNFVLLNISGIIVPIGTTNKMFAPPSPLQMEVELSVSEYSRRRRQNSIANVTYKWHHNYTRNINDKIFIDETETFLLRDIDTLMISRTNHEDAGVYSVVIDSFGFPSLSNRECATIILQALKNYAIFQRVEFHAFTSK